MKRQIYPILTCNILCHEIGLTSDTVAHHPERFQPSRGYAMTDKKRMGSLRSGKRVEAQ